MLPPNAPGVLVAIASLRAGATPRQPSIGRSGSSMRGAMSGASSRAVPFALSMIQLTRRGSRSTRATIDAGSTVYGASRLPEYAGRAIGLDLLDRDDEHVARLGAFDEERPGLRIRTLRDLLAVPVGARRIDRLGDHAVARLDPQRRRMRERERVVEALRGEAMRLGRLRGERPRGKQREHGGCRQTDLHY